MTDTLCKGTSLANTIDGCRVDFGPLTGLVLFPSREAGEFATHVLAKLQANWDDKLNAIKQLRGYPIYVQNVEMAEVESVQEETSGNDSFELSEKSGVDKYHVFGVGAEEINRLRTFKNQKLYVYKLYANNFFLGISPDGIKLEPIECRVFVSFKDGTKDTTQKIVIGLKCLEPSRAIDYMGLCNFNKGVSDMNVSDIKAVMDTNITVVSQTTSQVVVDVTSLRGSAVSALVAGDFVIKTAGGSVVPITTVTPDVAVEGRYILAATLTAGSYTVALLNQPNMATLYYEYNGTPVAFTTV